MLSSDGGWRQAQFLPEVELGLAPCCSWPSLRGLPGHQELYRLCLIRSLRVKHLSGGDQLLLLGVVHLLHLLRVHPLAHGCLLLLLIHQVDLHLLLLHLQIGLLFGGCWHSFSTLRAHPVISTHVVLNLLGLETVARILHVDSATSVICVLLVRLAHSSWVDSLRCKLLLHDRVTVLVVVGNGLLASNLIVLQLIVFGLGLVVLHVDHFVAAVVFVFLLVISRHDVLEILVTTIH